MDILWLIKGAYLAVTYLIENGHTNIAIIEGKKDHMQQGPEQKVI